MAGAMRKVAAYLGLVEDHGRYDEYDDEFDEYAGEAFDEMGPDGGDAESRDTRPERPATVASLAERRPMSVAASRSPVEAPRIVTLHPRNYNDARALGEHFRDGSPVIMNLSDMDDVDAKRLVDFAAGLIFGLRGSIDRVTAKVFLLSPADVEVTAEDRARIASGGFFNQS
ncbi:MAG TPA: cell division protein SepF [Jiangellaceae bacterium]|nr:cell division protein SepF [Jiangellaceae bacterium]